MKDKKKILVASTLLVGVLLSLVGVYSLGIIFTAKDIDLENGLYIRHDGNIYRLPGSSFKMDIAKEPIAEWEGNIVTINGMKVVNGFSHETLRCRVEYSFSDLSTNFPPRVLYTSKAIDAKPGEEWSVQDFKYTVTESGKLTVKVYFSNAFGAFGTVGVDSWETMVEPAGEKSEVNPKYDIDDNIGVEGIKYSKDGTQIELVGKMDKKQFDVDDKISGYFSISSEEVMSTQYIIRVRGCGQNSVVAKGTARSGTDVEFKFNRPKACTGDFSIAIVTGAVNYGGTQYASGDLLLDVKMAPPVKEWYEAEWFDAIAGLFNMTGRELYLKWQGTITNTAGLASLLSGLLLAVVALILIKKVLI